MPNVGYAAAEMPGIITSVGLHRGAPIQIPITDPVETSKSVMPQPPKDGAGAEEAKRLDAAYREALLLGTAQYLLDTVLRTAAHLQPVTAVEVGQILLLDPATLARGGVGYAGGGAPQVVLEYLPVEGARRPLINAAMFIPPA